MPRNFSKEDVTHFFEFFLHYKRWIKLYESLKLYVRQVKKTSSRGRTKVFGGVHELKLINEARIEGFGIGSHWLHSDYEYEIHVDSEWDARMISDD